MPHAPYDHVLYIASTFKSWEAELCVQGLISIFPSIFLSSFHVILDKPFKVPKSHTGQLGPREEKGLG